MFYRRLGNSFIQITCCLAEEVHVTAKIGVCKFIHHYKETGMISCMREAGSGKASKFTADGKRTIEEQMEKDNKTTGVEYRTCWLKVTFKWLRRLH